MAQSGHSAQDAWTPHADDGADGGDGDAADGDTGAPAFPRGRDLSLSRLSSGLSSNCGGDLTAQHTQPSGLSAHSPAGGGAGGGGGDGGRRAWSSGSALSRGLSCGALSAGGSVPASASISRRVSCDGGGGGGGGGGGRSGLAPDLSCEELDLALDSRASSSLAASSAAMAYGPAGGDGGGLLLMHSNSAPHDWLSLGGAYDGVGGGGGGGGAAGGAEPAGAGLSLIHI